MAKTVRLTHMDVLRLITPGGQFWNGCVCESCTALRASLLKAFPSMEIELRAREESRV